MEWISPLTDWFKANDALVWWLFAASVAMFLVTPVAVGWYVVRMPTDYFVKRRRRRENPSWQRQPVLRPLIFVGKNLLGVVLLVAGLVMLVVPGQGALTIVVGLMLVDFPGKQRLLTWLATRQSVWRSLNWLRKKLGRKPLERPS